MRGAFPRSCLEPLISAGARVAVVVAFNPLVILEAREYCKPAELLVLTARDSHDLRDCREVAIGSIVAVARGSSKGWDPTLAVVGPQLCDSAA